MFEGEVFFLIISCNANCSGQWSTTLHPSYAFGLFVKVAKNSRHCLLSAFCLFAVVLEHVMLALHQSDEFRRKTICTQTLFHPSVFGLNYATKVTHLFLNEVN